MPSVAVRIRDALFTEKKDDSTSRERWDSRFAFILAASGSAIGLGNLWRFPSLAFKWGGGAFFIPYWMALFLIGIPIFILELSLGQVIQSGDIACFGSMNKRLRGIGFGSIYGSFTVIAYYCVIISWALHYFVNCFRSPLPWAPILDDGGAAQEELIPEEYFPEEEGFEFEPIFEEAEEAVNTFFDASTDFFFNRVLKLSDPGAPPDVITAFNFAGLCFTWMAIAFIIWKGVSRTSKVVYITMILPLITIIILIIRGATLPNSLAGVKAYIGVWDLTVLSNGQVWTDAVGQIFFSIGVTFGVMTAYASYNSRHQDAVQDSIIVALMNSGVSFFAGFAVYSTLGFISQESGIAIEDMRFIGASLAFVTYPTALATLPGAGFFNAIFFLTLFFLGIDSAFSLVEAVTTAVRDSKAFYQANRGTITIVTCFAGFLWGCMYLTNVGLYLLDIIDHFISNITMLFIGMLECLAAGWIYRNNEQIDQIGALPVWLLGCSWVFGPALGCLIGMPIGSSVTAGVVLGFIIPLLGTIISAILVASSARDSKTDALWILFFYPIETLRADLNEVLCKENSEEGSQRKKWAIPFIWSILIKYFILPVLIVLFSFGLANAAQNPYEGYPPEYQFAGVFLGLVGVMLAIVPMWKYQWLDSIMPADESGHYLATVEQTGIATEMVERKTGGDTLMDDDLGDDNFGDDDLGYDDPKDGDVA